MRFTEASKAAGDFIRYRLVRCHRKRRDMLPMPKQLQRHVHGADDDDGYAQPVLKTTLRAVTRHSR
jgi:hypothetical protein